MSRKVEERDRLRLLHEENGERYYVFTPGLFRLFPKSGDMRKMTPNETALFLARLIHGYHVYLLADDKDELKGYTVISNGGFFRFPFADKEDRITGPTYTVPEYRGQGVAVRLGNYALNQVEHGYRNVYGNVAETNTSSLRRVQKSGFVIEGRLRIDRMKRFVKDENGTMFLIVYHNPNYKGNGEA